MKLLGQPLNVVGVYDHPADPQDPVVRSIELPSWGATLGVPNLWILRELDKITRAYDRLQDALEELLT